MPPRQQIIQCDSLRTLECELASIRDRLATPETEETWDTLAKAIARFTTLIQNGASNFPDEVSNGLRTIARPLNSAILSERSRLSGAAIDLLKAAAEGIGKTFDNIVPLYIPTLLTLCSRSNKVFISRSKACVIVIIEATQAPTILSYLAEAVKDKSLSLRLSAAEGGLACLNSFNPPDLEKEARAREVEAMIKATATDPSADVRKVSRQLFEAYRILLPHRVDAFTAPLTPTARKYLEIRSRAPSVQSNASSRPNSASSTNSLAVPQLAVRPKSAMSRSATTLFPTASGSNPDVVPARARTLSTMNGPGLKRSESAPSTSQSTSATATAAAPLRPVVGPSRPPPVPPVPQRGPTRPTCSRDMPPPATIPIRPQRPAARPTSSSPEPNPFVPADPNTAALRSSGGPLRPTTGPSRVPQDIVEKQRVMGGARRVLLPMPEPPQPAAISVPSASESKKSSSIASHSRTASNNSVDQAPVTTIKPSNAEASTSAPSKDAKLPAPSKAVLPPAKVLVKKVEPSKPKPPATRPVPSARVPSAPKRTDPSVSTSTTNNTTHHTTTTTTTRRTVATTSRLTEPTQSQMAKTRPTKTIATKKTEVAKPVGSRQAPTARAPAVPPPKATSTARKRVISTAPKPQAGPAPSPEVLSVAASVPLPSSPAGSPSPLPQAEDEENLETQTHSPTSSPANKSIQSTVPEVRMDLLPADEDQGAEARIVQDQDDRQAPESSSGISLVPAIEIREAETQAEDSRASESEVETPLSPSSPSQAIIQIDPATPEPSTPRPAFPTFRQTVPETPISSLLESIQRGFDFSPAPPFDPDRTFTLGGLVPMEVKCEPLVFASGDERERKPLHPVT
ncbi:clasp N terminal-domain-containing protein [Cristinia sonorae]|uniref:Clasp N terminal-domain-containing protein n=1 Tax=Cristinia sonorae TaxID=1940300 RepID=A0A8K0UJL2_9AGAR|nr:clasp N terminal-domain-containing protein [Cristinia sonorae]